MKKKISVALERDLDMEITKKAKRLGISKSALMAFSASYFLKQLNHLEKETGNSGVYELIKANIED